LDDPRRQSTCCGPARTDTLSTDDDAGIRKCASKFFSEGVLAAVDMHEDFRRRRHAIRDRLERPHRLVGPLKAVTIALTGQRSFGRLPVGSPREVRNITNRDQLVSARVEKLPVTGPRRRFPR
jgi:hypothetical protein